MTSNEIRSRYLAYFKERGHAIIPSASLVPENDPTTLFTGSGMQPLLPYFLGEPHPKGTRVTDSQKSFRAADIEEVGDNRHTTFFEMLGNWSFGDYFKKEQLAWHFDFLTNEIGLDPKKLYVTVYHGDESIGVPRDEESITIWQKLFAEKGMDAKFIPIGTEKDGYVKGMDGGRIFSYSDKNWWSRAGTPDKMPEGEPGGPDSEVFFEFSHIEHDPKWGEKCHPNCDCGRFLEIGNSVFMQYIKKGGRFEELPQKNVDFGGGLERVAGAVEGSGDMFKTDALWAIIDELQKRGDGRYEDNAPAFRIVADHMRGTTFMLTDGVLPANTDRGYFLRRLIRRAVRYADVIGFPAGELASLARVIARTHGEEYPEVVERLATTEKAIADEEARFRETLSRGLKEFEKLHKGDTVSGYDAYVLFTTHGFPLELTQELAKERGASVDLESFKKEMESHRDLSRAGAEQKFKGGLADQSEKTVRLHTAHHLLLKALQTVLGPHVKQRGSNITSERLRIDFSHGEKMTPEQIAEVERIVNEKIAEDLPVTRSTLPKEEAEKLGAEHEFGAKYPDMVSVYSVGPRGASESEPHFTDAFSIEFCGGPHVSRTGELGEAFKVQKEEAVAAGVRRIKATLS